MMRQDTVLKYLAAGLCLAVFLTVVVWLIQREGERTRETLREATVEAGKEVHEGIVEGAERLADKAAEVPGKVIRDVKDELGDDAKDAAEVLGDMAEGALTRAKDVLLGGPDKPDAAERGQTSEAGLPVETQEGISNGSGHPPVDAKDPKVAKGQKAVPKTPPHSESKPAAEAKPVTGRPGPQAEQPGAESSAAGQTEGEPPSQPSPETGNTTRKVVSGMPQPQATVDGGAGKPDEPDSDGKGREKEDSDGEKTVDLPGRVLRRAKEVLSERPDEAKPRTQGDAGKLRDPKEMLGDLFKLGHEVSKEIDEIGQEILGLSIEEERKVGREVHQTVRENNKVLDSHRMKGNLERLARPLLTFRERTELPYTFLVLDDATVNAFAHVGGYIYVTTGLLDFVETEAELQMVLGHEIAHVDLKHCTKQITYAARAAEATGAAGFTIAQLAYQVIATGYNEDREFEADQWGFRAVLRIGKSKEEALSFHRRFLKHLKKEGLEPEPRDPKDVLETTVQEVNNHFRTHPPTEERLQRLQALDL